MIFQGGLSDLSFKFNLVDVSTAQDGALRPAVRRREKENAYEKDPKGSDKAAESSGRALPHSRVNKKLKI